jgi:hypothetical protein
MTSTQPLSSDLTFRLDLKQNYYTLNFQYKGMGGRRRREAGGRQQGEGGAGGGRRKEERGRREEEEGGRREYDPTRITKFLWGTRTAKNSWTRRKEEEGGGGKRKEEEEGGGRRRKEESDSQQVTKISWGATPIAKNSV